MINGQKHPSRAYKIVDDSNANLYENCNFETLSESMINGQKHSSCACKIVDDSNNNLNENGIFKHYLAHW